VFFVDKDFEEPLTNPLAQEIYETSCYSIENFYTCPVVFERILKCKFNYNEANDEYPVLLDMYKTRHDEFQHATTLFNAWIACQRDSYTINPTGTERVNLGGFNLGGFIPAIDMNGVAQNYDIDKICGIFKKAAVIPPEVLESKVREFEAHTDKGSLFRGKFEVYFLRKFLESLVKELRSDNSRFVKMLGVHLNVSGDNIISELSQYAETPSDLKDYLMHRLAA